MTGVAIKQPGAETPAATPTGYRRPARSRGGPRPTAHTAGCGGRLLAALAVGLTLVACDGSQTPPPATNRSAGSRQATDQTGHTLSLPAGELTQIATPGISMASLIVVLGGHRALAAVAPEVRDNPWLRRIVPEIAQLPTPFTRPAGVNLEALLAVRPQLATLWLGNEPLMRRLEGSGIPVFNLGYTTPDEMKRAARLLGQAIGPTGTARAEAFVAYYDANLQRVSAGLADLPVRQRPRVYYASIAPLHTEGSASMVDAWITLAGGRNVAADGGMHGDGIVGLEQVLAWNPQYIVVLDETQRTAILADPRWQGIEAVRTGRVITNPRGINAWCTRAAEASLQVLWAAKLFHPERFSDLDVTVETRHFYRQFYAYDLNDDELARVLHGMPPAESPQPRSTP